MIFVSQFWEASVVNLIVSSLGERLGSDRQIGDSELNFFFHISNILIIQKETLIVIKFSIWFILISDLKNDLSNDHLIKIENVCLNSMAWHCLQLLSFRWIAQKIRTTNISNGVWNCMLITDTFKLSKQKGFLYDIQPLFMHLDKQVIIDGSGRW